VASGTGRGRKANSQNLTQDSYGTNHLGLLEVLTPLLIAIVGGSAVMLIMLWITNDKEK